MEDTKTIDKKLEVFQRRCLRRIVDVHYHYLQRRPLLYDCNQANHRGDQRRRWRQIGHVLRLPPTATARVALQWTPEGRRGRGRPKETWKRTVEAEKKQQGWTWSFLERAAQDRNKWKDLVEASCTLEH